MKYFNYAPPLDGRRFLYKGTRYFAFEVTKDWSYDCWERFHSIAVWDARIGVLGVGDETPEGTFKGELALSHVPIKIPECQTIREFIDYVIAYDRGYTKDCS